MQVRRHDLQAAGPDIYQQDLKLYRGFHRFRKSYLLLQFLPVRELCDIGLQQLDPALNPDC